MNRLSLPPLSGRQKFAITVSVLLIVTVMLIEITVVVKWWSVVAPGDPEPIPVAAGSGPGSVVAAQTMPQLPWQVRLTRVHAAKVTYRSTNGTTGDDTTVSGTVFRPDGAPPAGGWPVIAFGHGTTGINEPCAPSESDDLKGLATVAANLTRGGYAVSIADYQGLGAPGVHPYLDSKTAGLNMIDSVRALRAVYPGVSSRWAAFGGSQGGGASWAADEQSDVYAKELTMVGSVALSPAADVAGLVRKAQDGQLTDDQKPVLQWVVESLARSNPTINRADFRSGSAIAHWDVLSQCNGPQLDARTKAAAELGPHDIAPTSDKAARQLTDALQAYALPQRRPSAPMLVIYGGRDTYIDPVWTQRAVARACSEGAVIDSEMQPDKGHANVNADRAFGWLADRFADRPAPDRCQR
ncbi:lipase family protein [Williamsia sterculiae]|uniref:Secretory lipase n=1 Tax=Williamsia sterculiae TaxID=1344003 RepID=A0A1N7D059_9NOCA|nr:lipase family protein [Williamsia sterculiae]SIR69170.1 Secretory lipase [Williamsia sterculiae]